jgi:Flp pilus assembly protein TadG
MIKGIRTLVTRFRRNDEAVAAVEFALIVPFLITLYLGSIEAASLFTVDKRVNSLSATMGDLVAQWDPEKEGTLSTAELNSYMAAATGILAPYSTTGVQIVVSFVKVSKAATAGAGGATKVLWSKANAAGTKKTADQPYADLTLTSEMNKLLAKSGGCVVAAEVKYSYTPVLGQVFNAAITMTHTNYFLPRFGNTAPIQMQGEGTVDSKACTT